MHSPIWLPPMAEPICIVRSTTEFVSRKATYLDRKKARRRVLDSYLYIVDHRVALYAQGKRVVSNPQVEFVSSAHSPPTFMPTTVFSSDSDSSSSLKSVKSVQSPMKSTPSPKKATNKVGGIYSCDASRFV
jgi:hypothetical protein